MLAGKADFDEVLARFEAWWQGQMIDRPLLTINVRDGRSASTAPPCGDLRHVWMDAEAAIDRFEAGIESQTFVAETLPVYMPNLGPDICATVFGAELEFGRDTSWSRPVVGDCREILNLRPNLENEYWTTIRRMTDLSLKRGAGRWLTGITDLHTNGDLVAALRGPQEMCIDLADDPEGVAGAVEHVTKWFPAMYDDLHSRITASGQPTTTWAPYLATGRAYVTSCDFICMISRDMFRSTVLPSLRAEMQFLDRNMFHLDGPDALRHLDDLLALDELDAVQWTWGAGNGPAARWTDVYRKIQAAGKAMQILCESPADALAVAGALDSPRGCWFTVQGGYTLAQAHDLLAALADWSTGQRAGG
jgi:hypothetical protein